MVIVCRSPPDPSLLAELLRLRPFPTFLGPPPEADPPTVGGARPITPPPPDGRPIRPPNGCRTLPPLDSLVSLFGTAKVAEPACLEIEFDEVENVDLVERNEKGFHKNNKAAQFFFFFTFPIL